MKPMPSVFTALIGLQMLQATAQPAEPSFSERPLAQAQTQTRLVIGDGDTMAFAAAELDGERLVKGAPYCADALQESVQPLADGNRIVRRQTTRHCRDGDGRTRQEVERGGRTIVYLRDPVTRESWVLDPERKTARRLVGGPAAPGDVALGAQADASAWREYADRMRDWARSFRERAGAIGAGTPTPQTPPPQPPQPPQPAAPPAPALLPPGKPAAPGAAVAPTAPGAPRVHDTDVVVMRLDGADAPLPPLPGLPAMAAVLPEGVSLRAQLGAPRGQGAVSSLGSREIDGVKVNGERTTWTIDAGRIGNEKPIVITRDVWASPDLLVTVQSRDADPRSGESTYKLQNLRRGEPDPALMKVPADYRSSVRGAPVPRG